MKFHPPSAWRSNFGVQSGGFIWADWLNAFAGFVGFRWC